MTTPTPRWIDRAIADNTVARVIQTLIDAGYEPTDARCLVLDVIKDRTKFARKAIADLAKKEATR